MIRSNQVARWVWIAILPVMLSACGQNIFKGLAGDPERSSEDLLKRGDFSAAIHQAEAVIQRVQTGSDAQDAVSVKATAIMGQNNSLPQNTLQAVVDLSKDASANIVTQLNNSLPISPSASIVVADLLNYANDLSTSTNINVIPAEIASLLGISSASRPISIQTVTSVPNLALSPSLNSSTQFRRGVANATVVVKMVTLYLDITVDSTTTVTLNSTAISSSVTPRDVVIYLGTSARGVAYYGDNAIDAFQKSGVLTTNQLNSLTNLKTIGTNLRNLYAVAVASNTGTFTLKDRNGSTVSTIVFNGETGTALDTKYMLALTRIVNATTGGN